MLWVQLKPCSALLKPATGPISYMSSVVCGMRFICRGTNPTRSFIGNGSPYSTDLTRRRHGIRLITDLTQYFSGNHRTNLTRCSLHHCLMNGIDASAAAELVIMLAALALDSLVTPALMSTPTSLGGARRRCTSGTGVLMLSGILQRLTPTLFRNSLGTLSPGIRELLIHMSDMWA
jgi:hypothetical protein